MAGVRPSGGALRCPERRLQCRGAGRGRGRFGEGAGAAGGADGEAKGGAAGMAISGGRRMEMDGHGSNQ